MTFLVTLRSAEFPDPLQYNEIFFYPLRFLSCFLCFLVFSVFFLFIHSINFPYLSAFPSSCLSSLFPFFSLFVFPSLLPSRLCFTLYLFTYLYFPSNTFLILFLSFRQPPFLLISFSICPFFFVSFQHSLLSSLAIYLFFYLGLFHTFYYLVLSSSLSFHLPPSTPLQLYQFTTLHPL